MTYDKPIKTSSFCQAETVGETNFLETLGELQLEKESIPKNAPDPIKFQPLRQIFSEKIPSPWSWPLRFGVACSMDQSNKPSRDSQGS